jgi:hypothetical protein
MRTCLLLCTALIAAIAAAAMAAGSPAPPVVPSVDSGNPDRDFKNPVTRRGEAISGAAQPATHGATPPSAQPGDIARSFMKRYCEPDFISILANNRRYFGQEACLTLVRDDACARYKTLPEEIREALDEAVGCMFANGNGYAIEKNQPVAGQSTACGATYARRIELLKRYYTDYYANYALLFMPDDILDTPGRCVNHSEGTMPVLKK